MQLHQCACSSAPAGNGSDLGIRREWLPLFDSYEVDLVLSGHDHGYERSFPVRGPDTGAGPDALTGAAADTSRPHPVTTVDSGVFDTSQGTVHLVLGCAGPARRRRHRRHQATGRPRRTPAAAGTRRPRPGRPGLHPAGRPAPDGRGRPTARPADAAADGAVEAATWSARRDASTGYGIAVFDVNPGSEAGGQTSVTVRYYHDFRDVPTRPGQDRHSPVAGAPDGDYAFFETFTLVRPRSDGRRWHQGVAPHRATGAIVFKTPLSCGQRAPGLRIPRGVPVPSGAMTDVDAVVVGAGVIGLTTAISLAEAGLRTRVVTAEPPPATTSVAAGAIWGPVRCGPAERCYPWARTGLEVLSALAGEPGAGVHLVSGREVCSTVTSPPPWTDMLAEMRVLGPGDLPDGFVSGWAYTAPAVNMPVYLDYLLRRYDAPRRHGAGSGR